MNPDTYIAPVFNKFLDIIQRHANYLISASSYVKNLKNKRDVLVARTADMNAKIEGAERKSQKATNEVDVWKKQVDDILRKMGEVVNAYETRSCLCAICSGYKTGYRCDEMKQEVDRLLDVGSVLLTAEMMECDNSKAPILMRYVVPGSLELNFQKAMEYIEDVNSNANVLGIWGKGGVGKTTLLKRIHNSFTGRPIFGHVMWIVASSEQSNISRIQSEIAKELKLEFDVNDDVQSKARKIYNFLMNKNFLLFIDDLWEVVDLYEVGVPNPYEEGCGKHGKIVFTTLSKVVCGNMEAKKIIEVECLDSKQSWVLFKEKVGDDILSHRHILEYAKGVVEECKGLPLALITIGHAMSTKSKPVYWKNALKLMKDSQGHTLLGTDKQLLSVLKISYDFLPSERHRNCFLSISLWPEDHYISEEELINCWMGLDILNNFGSMDDAYQIGQSIIEDLLAASLLEHGAEKQVDFGGLFAHVKMHDVLRDLALWIASDYGENRYKWMVKAQTPPSHEVEKVECISLMHNRLNKLPSGITRCSNLLTLVLRGNQLTCESVSNCFHNFPSLKYLDLSDNDLEHFPEVICALTELQYLNLSYNYRIKNIPEKLRDLKKLKYLILRGNRIHNVPRGVFFELVKLLVLDLYIPNFEFWRKSPFVNVEELKWLEKKLLYLGITVSGDEAFNKLLDMSDLSIVHLSIALLQHITSFNFMSMIPNPYYCLRELQIGRCSLVEIIFQTNNIHQDLPSTNLEKLRLVELSKLEKIIWKDIKPKNLFGDLKDITLYRCNLLDDITWVIHLRSLVRLYIAHCDNMRIAINNEQNDNNTYEVESNILTFPSLKKLEVNSMVNLEKISTRSLAFPELGWLNVYWCPLLKTLPFEIKSTPRLEMIEGSKKWWDKVEWEDDGSKSHFSQLFHGLDGDFNKSYFGQLYREREGDDSHSYFTHLLRESDSE